jgi:PEGA domain-containing protein
MWPAMQAASPAPVLRSIEADGLDAFGSEAPVSEPAVVTTVEPEATAPALVPVPASRGTKQPSPNAPPPAPRAPGRSKALTVLTWALVVLVSAAVAAVSVWQYQRRVAAHAAGTLTIQTTPAGADVFIAGQLAGRTPLTTNLAPGAYDVRVTSGQQSRDLKVTLAAGASTFHEIDLPKAAPVAEASAKGALRVQTDVKQATVSVDGVERGVSPLTLDDLEPGDHQVVLRGDRGTVRRTVHIKPHETLSLMISGAEPAAPMPGWLSVTSPVAMQLREDGKLLGTTETERLMLPSGEHTIEVSNEPLGYRSVRTITIAPGKATTSNVELPMGYLSVNASPWAEVSIDGERIGETPIANLSRRIGEHRVTFRHPQLGERTETVVVTLRQPARLGVDMRRPTQ